MTWVYEENYSYSFSPFQLNPPLAVLGGGFVKMRAICKARSDASWEVVGITFRIDDPFDGALSGLLPPPAKNWIEGRFGELDWPFSRPYNMYLEWYYEDQKGWAL